MSVIVHKFEESHDNSIFMEIENHPAWIGNVPGLKADKMLRGKKAYQFVLRAGEERDYYYVTFAQEDGSVRHIPFTLWTSAEGWHYENNSNGGPFKHASIDDVLHLIMHCHKNECAPYTNSK
jgi:hypothetical protein